jgi:acetolactate synthase I/II/III large subunit
MPGELQDGSVPRAWGSDVMVDAMQARGLRYVTMNPGSSFRGLHDSIVNYGGNRPEMIECTHEKIAVEIAHGYAKASGDAIGCILHNTVGLLHGTMGIYYAYIDRAPVVIFGGAGPMAIDRRRPNIDWIHTANVQGNLVRDYTKWDDQPASLASVHETVNRGYRVAVSEPQGPVYIALDAGLQEDRLDDDIPPPDVERFPVPTRIGPDPEALERLAQMLIDAQRPILIPGYAGRDPKAMGLLVELAELLGAGVIDTNIRLNFPTRHPLNVTESEALEEADLVVFVDVKDMGKSTQKLDKVNRRIDSRIPDDALIADIGFNDLEISAWSHDFAQLHPVDHQVTADTVVALPLLLERCRELEARDPGRREARAQRKEQLQAHHEATQAQWRAQADEVWQQQPVSTARLAGSVWEAVKDHDFVLTAGTASDWALRLWDLNEPYQHPGASLGTGTQFGISLGVALAHKGSGRLVVDLQPDGDLLFDVGAMFTAAYHEIPLLCVMFNNRAYYNDWAHQERMARQRGTPMANAYYGMEIDGPAPDFANIARSFGWYGEGPIEDPDEIEAAVRRAAKVVLDEGRPALVDVICDKI